LPFETFSGFKDKSRHDQWIEPESWTHTKKHFVLLIRLRDIDLTENDIIRDAVKEALP